MAIAHNLGWGMAGAATTMLARKATRSAMHERTGAPRLPQAARQHTFGMMLLLAAAAGVMLALGDVFKEQRKHAIQVT